MKTVITTLLQHSISQLPKNEERQLLIRAKKGDLKARHVLVQLLMRYGVLMAKKYNGKGMDEDDYTQLAMIGILESIDTYNLKHATRLSTHAHWRIRCVMTKAQMKGELIRVPSGTSKKRKDGNLPQPKNMIELDDFDLPEVGRDQEIEADSLWFLPLLTKRERLIIQCRFFWKLTLGEIGGRVNVSKERIRQITVQIFWRVRYAEHNSRCEAERTRLFHRSRRLFHSAQKTSATTFLVLGNRWLNVSRIEEIAVYNGYCTIKLMGSIPVDFTCNSEELSDLLENGYEN